MFALAILPGIPAIPFLALGFACGGAAYFVNYRDRTLEELAIQELEQEKVDLKAQAEEPISTALKIDHIRLEMGYGLLTLINAPRTVIN